MTFDLLTRLYRLPHAAGMHVDVRYCSLQGKKIPGYEVEVKMSWEGEVREGGKEDGTVISTANGEVGFHIPATHEHRDISPLHLYIFLRLHGTMRWNTLSLCVSRFSSCLSTARRYDSALSLLGECSLFTPSVPQSPTNGFRCIFRTLPTRTRMKTLKSGSRRQKTDLCSRNVETLWLTRDARYDHRLLD